MKMSHLYLEDINEYPPFCLSHPEKLTPTVNNGECMSQKIIITA